MKLIHSRDNPFYKELTKLASSARHRNKTKKTFLDGTHLLAAYLDIGGVPQHILLNTSALQNDEITTLLDRLDRVPITQLDDNLFAELSELSTPTGILALIEPPSASRTSENRFVLLLEDIQDPGNLGSMIRSAAAAGCEAVFLSKGCADVWSPKVLRAAMGGHFALSIFDNQDLHNVAKTFSGTCLASSLQATHSLYDCDLSGSVAFMVGNEGAGLSSKLSYLATKKINIPMSGQVESLNVAAATAICLFEVVRQRK